MSTRRPLQDFRFWSGLHPTPFTVDCAVVVYVWMRLFASHRLTKQDKKIFHRKFQSRLFTISCCLPVDFEYPEGWCTGFAQITSSLDVCAGCRPIPMLAGSSCTRSIRPLLFLQHGINCFSGKDEVVPFLQIATFFRFLFLLTLQ